MDTFDEINEIKRDFLAWDNALDGKDYLPLEDAYLQMKKALRYFPNIVFTQKEYPLTIYRARIISKDSHEDISNPQTFSYPPIIYSTSYQRASVPGFPVFYGAMDAKTALEELRTNCDATMKKGDKFYLSEWKVKKGMSLTFNCLTHFEIVGNQYLFSQLTEQVKLAMQTIMKNTNQQFQEVQTFIYNKISQMFLTGKYLQTGPIAYKILYDCAQDEKPDAILYPSCSNNFQSINCAFHPDFVNQKMTLETVRKCTFQEFTTNQAHTLSYFFGLVENEKISWKNWITKMRGKYIMTLDLTLNWTDETIDKATFFVSNEPIDITKFCENLIDNIDFNAIDIPKKHADFTKSDKRLKFIFEYPLENENCYFKNIDCVNILKAIKLTIPAENIINNVSAKEVIKF